MSKHPDTLITLMTGKQDRGARATLAFSWGCASLAMGKEVTIYLTMEGTIWATKGAMKGVKVEGFDSLEDYLEQFLALGGELLVCAPCTEYYCSFDRSQINGIMVEDAELTGLATIVSKMGENTKVVTF
ncbi:DsrE family protein [candidate division KSB1 bacterium]|nr:DsrE family protein [candidate division KSB1 bacterium]